VRREFLGEVRCLVFDVSPQRVRQRPVPWPHVGRRSDYNVVRFNGAYGGAGHPAVFHFDSWRTNVQPACGCLPLYTARKKIYTRLAKNGLKAQTGLGYNVGRSSSGTELIKILVRSRSRRCNPQPRLRFESSFLAGRSVDLFLAV